jgi:hypothetical protein
MKKTPVQGSLYALTLVPDVTALSDAEVLALSDLHLPPDQDARLSDLLDQQQAVRLTDAERNELGELLQVYRLGLLRKAQALSEAVRRGLRPPLEAGEKTNASAQ